LKDPSGEPRPVVLKPWIMTEGVCLDDHVCLVRRRRGESWMFPRLSLVILQSYAYDGAAQLTRMHDELNRQNAFLCFQF
ncbi:hypothetical protein T02_11262, partial [Trichinella nativa]